MSEAFAHCEKMGNVELPNGLKSIGGSAFHGCANITEMRLPLSVEYVGNNAFAHCAKLTDIYLLRIKPIEIDNETAFPFEPCRINIPKGSVDSYQFTPKWKKYNYREVRVN